MPRGSLALLGLALLLGTASAVTPSVTQLATTKTETKVQTHAAKISAVRDIHAAKVSAVRDVMLLHPAVATAAGFAGDVAAAQTPVAVPAQCLSVAEVATKAGNFTALLAAAQAAGLAPALSDKSLQATVFAPTDKAFGEILEALGITAAELLSKPDLLAAILKYHVVPGAPILSNKMQDDLKLPTLLAADLEAANAAMGRSYVKKGKAAMDEPEDGVLVLDVKNVFTTKRIATLQERTGRQITVVGSLTSAAVLVADVQAGCPAVVHVIDTVLLPDIIDEPTLWESLATIWATGGAVAADAKPAPIDLLAPEAAAMGRTSLAFLALGLLLHCSLGSAQLLGMRAPQRLAARVQSMAGRAADAASALATRSAATQTAVVSGVQSRLMAKHPRLAAMFIPPVAPVCLSVVEAAAKASNFTIFLEAAKAANLTAFFSDELLQATVFLPTDAAFEDLIDSLGVTNGMLLSKPNFLAAVLKYHVVPGTPILSSDMSDEEQLVTVLTAELQAAAAAGDPAAPSAPARLLRSPKAKPEDGKLTLDVETVVSLKSLPTSLRGKRINVSGGMSSAEVLVPDLQAGCPTVLHVVDTVLLPNLVGEEKEVTLFETLATIWATGGASAADDLAEAKAEAEVDPAAAAFVAKDVAALRAQQAAGELQDR